MKNLIADIRITIVVSIISIVVCAVYALVVWGLGQALFNRQANGSLILGKDGTSILGSELIGQAFSDDKYFNSRPSAAGTGYDATSSGGTNLGPTSQKLRDSVKSAVDAYRKQNSLASDALVPADAVTSSGSGLDPDISVKNALLQAPRVARVRNMALNDVRAMVQKYTKGRDLGIFGEPRVNVLELNLALDGKI